jgi:uncharacterized protein YegP (UPF0339 family)
MPAKFTVYLDKGNKFRFNLKAANGEIIAASESYPDKKSALKGIASVAKNAPVAKIVDNTVTVKKAVTAKPKPKAKNPVKTEVKPAPAPLNA